jgi:hypothetical protein
MLDLQNHTYSLSPTRKAPPPADPELTTFRNVNLPLISEGATGTAHGPPTCHWPGAVPSLTRSPVRLSGADELNGPGRPRRRGRRRPHPASLSVSESRYRPASY